MKNSFLIYYDFEEQTAALTDAQVGRLMRMILAYERRGEVPTEGEPELIMAFRFLKPSLDTNREKYDRVCQRNKRTRAKALLTTGDDR